MAETVRITASEFRQNFGTYMKGVEHTDYEVTRNGRVVGLWTNPHRDKMELVRQLAGSVRFPEGFDENKVLEERRRQKFGNTVSAELGGDAA